MSNLLINLKKSFSHLSYPFIFTSLFLLIVNLISLIQIDELQMVYSIAQDNIELIFGTLAVFFVSYYKYKAGKIAITSSISYILFDLVLCSISSQHSSLVMSLAFAFLSSRLPKDLELVYRFAILALSATVVAIGFGACYQYLFSALKLFCSFVSKRPLLFGVFDNAYSLLFGDGLSSLMLGKDYSGSTVIKNELVAGVQNAFELNPNEPIRSVSYYMSGRYFLSTFSTIGIFVALYNRFDKNEVLSFILCCVQAFLFGDIKLLSLLLLCFNPAVYLAYLAMTFVCYLLPVLLDIRIGFLKNGSIIELIKYGQRWVYFLVAGVIIAIMTYFVLQLVLSKFDIEKNRPLPRDVKRIVTALGGERNIERLDDKNVYVKNPNLIDILRLDCDIHENVITLHYGELELLKEYF